MNNHKKSMEKLLESLQERAKELNCLYAVEEILNTSEITPPEAFRQVVEVIPPGWQYPDICQARISFDGEAYQTGAYIETPWEQNADIQIQDRVVGSVTVSYTREMPSGDAGPFLKEETKLISTIADRLGHFLLHYQIRQMFQDWDTARRGAVSRTDGEWKTVLKLLRTTDRNLYLKISHQMLNLLCRSGIREAELLLERSTLHDRRETEKLAEDSNRPHRKQPFAFPIDMSAEVFRIASEHMTDEEIAGRVQRWIQEDKLSFLVQVVNRNLPLSEVADAVRRYHHLTSGELDPDSPAFKGVTVSLLRRFLSDQLAYIRVAKKFVHLDDFYELLGRIIFAAESHGKLGGKSAGLYLASQMLKRITMTSKGLHGAKVPKTWYISSDMLLLFMHFNNLDEIVEQKYKPIDQVRFEYPHVVQTFKNSRFPSEMLKGLSVALDDFGERPLIVRSSSLLEDQVGAAFSGKYKSLFLANQGSKQKRLDALCDAIAEVYASTFGPDPIEYRAERGLIDFGEEMGIMIQEVVGTRVGDYYLPAFAGVVFSRNEFRWSPRIHREDGLVRLVPGLGTRAVDRLSDDYPVLVAPGQPGLRVNTSADDILRYSPRYVDVIDLKKNTFETIEISQLLHEYGYQYPMANRIFSIYDDGHIRKPTSKNLDFDDDELLVTFEGLISDTDFIKQVKEMIAVLERELGMPVDIEFAHDGKSLYLLQCRAQSHDDTDFAAPIPKDVRPERLVFSANRYVSNGRVPDITHIVYVDPDSYAQLSSREDLLQVGRAVGKLNKLLPKRKFVLMGPGRWGSRGDIKLGVSVTYSDINNAAVLIEVARKRGNYVPDLSFGTHFFQDLVEAQIRYLPLYPDDEGVAFNEIFLKRSPNILGDVLPEFASLSETVRLIDVTSVTEGLVMQVLMNAELDEAVGILSDPRTDAEDVVGPVSQKEMPSDKSWRWRLSMAEQLAAQTNPRRFGVRAMYIFGSTKNASAGPASDIDLLVHVEGNAAKLEALRNWFEGWSVCLDEVNYLRTGYRAGGLLDVHFVTDEDIKNKTSYAAKIDAVTDAARPLVVGSARKR